MRCWRAARPELLGLCAASILCCAVPPPAVPDRPPLLDPDRVQRGAFVFMDPRSSGELGRSCASCHPGGGSNGGIYREGVDAAPGEPGARNVPALWGAWQSAPYLWDGSAPELRRVIERMLRLEMGGALLPGYDVDALDAYVRSLAVFDRGRLEPDGMPVEPVTLAARRGAEVFLRAKCDGCHPAPAFFRPEPADVGTGMPVDIPTLRGVGSTPPYGHDGRWATLEQAVDAMLAYLKVDLSEREHHQLVEYLKLF